MTEAEAPRPAGARSAEARFRLVIAALVARLPLGLDELVAPTLVGFVLINSSTFALDLVLLTLLHGAFDLALPIAFTVAYVTAFATSFALNRWLNFRSHAPVGRQAVIYAVAVAINYLAFILGVATGLAAMGVEYHVSRVAAGLCEAAYMYCVLRWVVFRDRSNGNASRVDARFEG